MHTETVPYADGDAECLGYLASLSPAGPPRPCVLVAHAWGGQDDFARSKAEALAELGYVGFALDLYGGGRVGDTPAEKAALMQPFMDDRRLLRRRLQAAVLAATHHPLVDPHAVGAIGFCFGGLCVLDLARSAMPEVKAVVSFHGLLSPPQIGPQPPIFAKILVLHGHDDPLAPPAAVAALTEELDAAGADWQIHIHGGAMHAFTNPAANSPENGLQHHALADRRSWQAMQAHLAEALPTIPTDVDAHHPRL